MKLEKRKKRRARARLLLGCKVSRVWIWDGLYDTKSVFVDLGGKAIEYPFVIPGKGSGVWDEGVVGWG